MNEELLGVIAEALRSEMVGLTTFSEDYPFVEEADDVLEAIAAAGFVLVERERWERCQRECRFMVNTFGIKTTALQPGDLDGDV